MTNHSEPLILGIGGTPVAGSTTEKALRVSLAAAQAAGARTRLISGEALMIPMYTPDQSLRTPEALALVEAMRSADGLILASPAYHGSISGLMKNVLDYTEDMRTDDRVYFDGVGVGLISCAGGWQAGAQTLATLRGIVHALRGWPTPLGAALNTSTPQFDPAGQPLEISVRMQLETVGQQVTDFARMRRSYHAVRAAA